MGFLNNGTAISIETALAEVEAATAACENIAAGINSMTDTVTATVYGYGINDGYPYLEELEV